MSKHKDPFPLSSSNELSRRKFLKSAASGSAIMAAAVTLPAQGTPKVNKDSSKTNNPFEEVLRLYGSEFGDIRESE
jgi:secreted PhoX family phosphatase